MQLASFVIHKASEPHVGIYNLKAQTQNDSSVAVLREFIRRILHLLLTSRLAVNFAPQDPPSNFVRCELENDCDDERVERAAAARSQRFANDTQEHHLALQLQR